MTATQYLENIIYAASKLQNATKEQLALHAKELRSIATDLEDIADYISDDNDKKTVYNASLANYARPEPELSNDYPESPIE